MMDQSQLNKQSVESYINPRVKCKKRRRRQEGERGTLKHIHIHLPVVRKEE
jgi:hypothetical protein